MAVDEDEGSDIESGLRDGLQDVVMNGEELEVGVSDEEGRGGEDDSDENDYDDSPADHAATSPCSYSLFALFKSFHITEAILFPIYNTIVIL